MGCSICGADGVTKQTCPFNSAATHPKPTKHNAAPLRSGSGAAVAQAPAYKVKPKFKVAHGAVAVPKIKAKVKPVAQVQAPGAGLDLGAAEAEARRLFPGDLKTQQEYVADLIGLEMPNVPMYDEVSRRARQKQEKLKADRAVMADRCQRCLKAIRARGMVKDADWFTVSSLCTDCHQHIGTLFHNPEFKEKYNKYHRGTELPVDQLIANGARDGFYNATMYDGAKFWANAAGRRAGKALPNVPKGNPKGWQ